MATSYVRISRFGTFYGTVDMPNRFADSLPVMGRKTNNDQHLT